MAIAMFMRGVMFLQVYLVDQANQLDRHPAANGWAIQAPQLGRAPGGFAEPRCDADRATTHGQRAATTAQERPHHDAAFAPRRRRNGRPPGVIG